MGLSKLSETCKACMFVDSCNNKKMEAVAFFDHSARGENNTHSPLTVSTPTIEPMSITINVELQSNIHVPIEAIQEGIRKDFERRSYCLGMRCF